MNDRPPADFELRWRERFGRFARTHEDEALIAGWTQTGLATRMRQFERMFSGPAQDSRWIDAGCGAGTYTRWLADRGARVVGFDYSEPTVAHALRRVGDRALFAVADATRLPVRDGDADGVLCFGVTQALAESAALARALVSAVRPGGEIWVDALNARCFVHELAERKRRRRGAAPHLRYETAQGLSAQLRQAGAEDVRVMWMPMAPGRLAWLQPWLESGLVGRLLRGLPGLAEFVCHSFMLRGHRRSA